MSHSSQIRALSEELLPIPTEEVPSLCPLGNIEAVAFDIYGTLIVSGSGDIGLVDETARESAMAEALAAVGVASSPDRTSQRFYELIREEQGRSSLEYPEVEIREVWESLLGTKEEMESDLVEQLAIAYECRTNPVWPMPGLAETLEALRNRGLKLGIVSNAQFYTPHLFEAFLSKPLQELGFPPENQIYSYVLREGKPSTKLYRELAGQLDPATTLYVGNDMLKDIWPAAQVGFRTALFAGDARSLRKREDDDRVAGTSPDLVLTELTQILSCLPS